MGRHDLLLLLSANRQPRDIIHYLRPGFLQVLSWVSLESIATNSPRALLLG
jgi:hypothetical protein